MNTLQSVLDDHLGLPLVIHRRDNRTMVKTSKQRILRGEVKVNDMTVTDPGMPVKRGDHVRYGLSRYHREYFFVHAE